jgi:UDP-GlcNAc:undecaprenyl-phosphate GlcNAc-1-phosphate transferase
MSSIHGSILTAFAIGGTVALVVSAACIRWVAPLGWTDQPDARKQHRVPTPRTAGLALWLLLMGVLAAGCCPPALSRVEWAAINGMALLGFLDDRWNLRNRHKALVGLVVAVVLALEMAPELGRHATAVNFLGLTLPNHLLVTVPLLTLWFWSIPQAFNLIDGINGLSIGFSLILLTVLSLVLGYAPIGGYLEGALIMVLVLNYPRAKHFLGDCGSLMLGTLFAILSAKTFAAADANLLLWVFAYPAVDVALVVAVRKWNRAPLGIADRSHMHHFLVDRLGTNQSWLVPVILLSLALLTMTRTLDFPGHEATSLLGLTGLLLLASSAFRDRVSAPKVVVPLQPLRVLQEAGEPNRVA